MIDARCFNRSLQLIPASSVYDVRVMFDGEHYSEKVFKGGSSEYIEYTKYLEPLDNIVRGTDRCSKSMVDTQPVIHGIQSPN